MDGCKMYDFLFESVFLHLKSKIVNHRSSIISCQKKQQFQFLGTINPINPKLDEPEPNRI